MKQSSALPTNKVIFSGLAGALTVILVWAARAFGKVEIPPEVASAITVVIQCVTAYITPPSDRDAIEQSP